jgi:hypothetical protein
MATHIISHIQKEIKLAKKQGVIFYVYILCRPCGTPFYVGKATIKTGTLAERIFEHRREALNKRKFHWNAWKNSIIAKIERGGERIIYEIDSFHKTDESTKDRECQLIRHLGRRETGGILANLTDGADGVLGIFKTQRAIDSQIKNRRKPLDALRGKRFGKLKVLSDAFFKKHGRKNKRYVRCVCDCGKTVEVLEAVLSRSRQPKRDCGCTWKTAGKLKAENAREYRSWQKIRDTYPVSEICEEWIPRDSFPVFLEQMGEKPNGFFIARVDNSKPWSATNCRWSRVRKMQKATV